MDEENVQEQLNFDNSEPGHTALAEEIVQAVSRSAEVEDDKLITDKPAIPPNDMTCVRRHKSTTIC